MKDKPLVCEGCGAPAPEYMRGTSPLLCYACDGTAPDDPEEACQECARLRRERDEYMMAAAAEAQAADEARAETEMLRAGLREALELAAETQSDCMDCSAWLGHEEHAEDCRYVALRELAGW